MPLKAETMTREFKYGELELPDPNPQLTPEQVCEFYAGTYPELNNASVDGPVTRGSRQIYTLEVSYGSKG